MKLKAITVADGVKNVAKNMTMQKMRKRRKTLLAVIADGVKSVVINCT
tara:strand:- start:116 stop:259 length:144 start_codon:yes stop_codon:yes gene_type:complete